MSKYKLELQSKFGVLSISLFGSYARNEENSESDIDIAVDMEKADLFTMASLKNYLQELLGKKVDVIRIRKNMNTILKNRIEKDAIYVR
ncbi:MAG: nucleotidyltransferase family protein [Bacteroidota bacterium]